jgi:hypothetical protein
LSRYIRFSAISSRVKLCVSISMVEGSFATVGRLALESRFSAAAAWVACGAGAGAAEEVSDGLEEGEV